MKQIFVLTYSYTNKKLAQMAIACVIRCRSTHGKQLRVRDIIEMNRPGLYQQLSRGDKCRVGRAVSKLYNQGMLPHLTRGKKKGSTNTYFWKEQVTMRKLRIVLSGGEIRSFLCMKKLLFPLCCGIIKGKKLKTQQGGKCNGCLLESGKCRFSEELKF